MPKYKMPKNLFVSMHCSSNACVRLQKEQSRGCDTFQLSIRMCLLSPSIFCAQNTTIRLETGKNELAEYNGICTHTLETLHHLNIPANSI